MRNSRLKISDPTDQDKRLLARAIANAKGERAWKPYYDKMDRFVRPGGKLVIRRTHSNPGIPYWMFALRNATVARIYKAMDARINGAHK